MTRPRRTLPLPSADRKFLSVLEAAALIGIGETTIRDLVRQNKIPHVRIGRRILFRREDLDRMMTPEPSATTAAPKDAVDCPLAEIAHE
jgi:excisionase family DNA binding protein